VIRDIVEVGAHFGADAWEMPANQLSDQFSHGAQRAFEAGEFASQFEEPGDFCFAEKVA
jgi:hypothetical protein